MIAKGRLWQELERHLSPADPEVRLERRVEMLARLRDRATPLSLMPSKRHREFRDGFTEEDCAIAIAHFQEEWLGYKNGKAQDRATPTTWAKDTGWWANWHGDAEEIMRVSMCRVIELSLGLDHDEDTSGLTEPPRLWEIDLDWACPVPAFQTAIRWRRIRGTDNGVVTATWLTPGPASIDVGSIIDLLPPPKDPKPPAGVAGELRDPESEKHIRQPMAAKKDPYDRGTAVRERGMWLVGHERVHVSPFTTIGPQPKGVFASAIPRVVSYAEHKVITVQPGWHAGGVHGWYESDDEWAY